MKSSDQWGFQGSVGAISPVETPLLSPGVVESERHPPNDTCGALSFEFIRIRPALPDRPRHYSCFKFVPLGASFQPFSQTAVMNFPGAHVKIKVFFLISFHSF